MTTDRTVRLEDVAGLRSRISWGAVIAGSVVALAVYLVLALFCAAVGLSVSDAEIRAGTLTNGALIAAAVCMIVALLAGGCVTTQLTAGETQTEAVIHGVLTWATVTALSMMMVSSGVKAGYNAMLGAATASDHAGVTANRSMDERLRAAGVSQEQIDRINQGTTVEGMRAAANDPANREQAREMATRAAWYALGGTLLSIGAAIGGAIFGSGPRFRLIPVTVSGDTGRPIVAH